MIKAESYIARASTSNNLPQHQVCMFL